MVKGQEKFIDFLSPHWIEMLIIRWWCRQLANGVDLTLELAGHGADPMKIWTMPPNVFWLEKSI